MVVTRVAQNVSGWLDVCSSSFIIFSVSYLCQHLCVDIFVM